MVSSSQRRKRLDRIRQRRCKSVRFDDLCWLLEAYGFVLDRTAGTHYTYTHALLERIITVHRPHNTSEVKRGYCKQVLKAIEDVIDLDERDDSNEW